MEQRTDIFAEKRHLGALGRRLWRSLALVGAVALLASLVLAATGAGGWHRFLFAYLVNFAFVLSLALGALYFVILHHLTHSGWSVVVRRIGEALSAALPLLALLIIPVLVGLERWTNLISRQSRRPGWHRHFSSSRTLPATEFRI